MRRFSPILIRMIFHVPALLTMGAVFFSGSHSPLAQSQSPPGQSVRVPLFLLVEENAFDVAAPLGPGGSVVLSQVSILIRGNGRAFLGGTPLRGSPAQMGDGMMDAEAFFDIDYQIDFIDTDSGNDFAPEFLTGPGQIRLRQPRGQNSRLQGSGTCTPDTSAPNFGCVPQLAEKDGMKFEDITRSLGNGFSLVIPERALELDFVSQVPLGINQIFTDGFESGDTSSWSVVSGAGGSSAQGGTPSPFAVAASGTLEIQEKVVVSGTQLTNHFSLIGAGSASNLGFQTTMIFTNTGGESDLQVEFFDSTGQPLAVSLSGVPFSPAQITPMTAFNTILGPGQALSIQTAGQDDLKVGYARFTAGPSVGATAVFTRSDASSGAILYDAGVPSITRPLKRFSIFLDSLGSKDTGLAMVRPGRSGNGSMVNRTGGAQDPENNVTMRLFDADFNPIGSTGFFIPEGAQVSRFIHEYFADQPQIAAQAREMQGVVVVESKDLLAAITLRSTEDPDNPTLTAFPVIEGRAESSMREALSRGSGRNR